MFNNNKPIIVPVIAGIIGLFIATATVYSATPCKPTDPNCDVGAVGTTFEDPLCQKYGHCDGDDHSGHRVSGPQHPGAAGTTFEDPLCQKYGHCDDHSGHRVSGAQHPGVWLKINGETGQSAQLLCHEVIETQGGQQKIMTQTAGQGLIYAFGKHGENNPVTVKFYLAQNFGDHPCSHTDINARNAATLTFDVNGDTASVVGVENHIPGLTLPEAHVSHAASLDVRYQAAEAKLQGAAAALPKCNERNMCPDGGVCTRNGKQYVCSENPYAGMASLTLECHKRTYSPPPGVHGEFRVECKHHYPPRP